MAPSRALTPARARDMALSDSLLAVSRDGLLRATTFLSRTFEGLRRLFGRARAVLVHERFMHASCDWALSPAQRLLPSTFWPFVQTAAKGRRATGSFAGADALVDAGFAIWRGIAAMSVPALPAPPSWPLLPPPSSSKAASGVGAAPGQMLGLLAPLFGFAAAAMALAPTGTHPFL